MSNSEERIKDIWEELIIKEKLKAILIKIEEGQVSNRQIIKEELTELWNISEIPIFKQILEKLTVINNCLENNSNKKQVMEEDKEKEMVPINVIGRLKEPVMMDISKSKPKLTIGVKRGINSLAELHKLGKF